MKYFLLAVFIPFAIMLHAQGNANQKQGNGNQMQNNQQQNNPNQKQGNANQNQAQSNSKPNAGSESQQMEKYPKLKWRKKLKIARQKIADGSYISAAEYLEDVYKAKPDKIEVTHLLATVNRWLRDYETAEKFYKATITKDPIAYPADQFYLGEMQKMNGHYEDAKKTFQDYEKTKLDKGEDNLKPLAKIEIMGCDSAMVITKNPTKIRVEKTEGQVNTPLQDMSPKVLKDNRIMFASMKSDTAVDNTTSKTDYYTSIYTAERSGKAYINKKIFSYPPNDHHANVNNAVFSGDEKMIIYTKCNDSLDLDNRAKCKLYRSTKKNATEWTAGEELKSLNAPDASTTQPAFGYDATGNDVLYFSSNRKGTKGGYDIFYAKVNADGTFGAVTSAGDQINTVGDEITPFYDIENKALYFSSNGHASIGGLDVFKSNGAPGHWGPVMNCGVPINSQADDFYFALDSKGTKGFEVSNRIGTTSPRGATCCDDIWTVTILHDITLKATYVKRGDLTNTPIVGVDASLYKVNGNNFEFAANAKTTSVPSLFPVKRGTSYKINGNKEGYWPSIDNLSIAEDEDRDTITKIFFLDPIIKLHVKIPNVYFAFDKSNVIDFYKGQIDSVVKVLTDHPGYSIEIQGHTDSKGSDEYNQKLSERRAMEVKNFMVKDKGIAEARIVTKWFGKTVPAVPNELPNGEDDPEGRARNRRVEFKVIPDKPEDAPEIENTGEVVKEVKTGPGYVKPGVLATQPKKKK
jgi:outer membrane protein OmpA-like peptidoglycan-associated protein/tetratricopeptide (TPR) repeat protein